MELGRYAILIKVYTGLSLALTLVWIGMNHPHEYLYFNPLFRGEAAKNTVQDYWAVSYKELLSQIRDGSVTDVYIYPRLTGNQLFGEAGFENYHLEALEHSAKYRIEEGNPGDNAFYSILKTVEVDGRICNSLIRRENYGNVLRKYYYEDGEFTGANYGEEVEFEARNEGTTQSILIRVPDTLQVKELDILFGDMYSAYSSQSDEDEEGQAAPVRSKESVLSGEKVFTSSDGVGFCGVSPECLLREDDLLGISAQDGNLPEYILFEYENRVQGSWPEMSFRFYGDEPSLARDRDDVYYNRYEAARVIKSLASSDPDADTSLVLDGREDTAAVFKGSATGGESMDGGEYLTLELNSGVGGVRGFHLDCGSDPMGFGRNILIESSADGKDYTEVPWYYGAADDLLFESDCNDRYYRISQTGRGSASWTVAELGIIHR